jgi:hypothetical protein
MYSSARRFMALAAFFCVAVSGQKLTFNNGKGICHFVQDAAGTSVISDCDMEVKSVGLKSLYDRVVTIEGKMVKLEQRIKANEDDLDLSNAGALTNMEARVTKIKKDVHETPLLHHAFGAHTCVDGQVNKETRQCVCNTGGNGFLNRYGGGSYQSGEKYEACTQCDNRVCKSTLFAEQYRTGACSTAAGNNFNCVDCPNSACSSSQWRTGKCGATANSNSEVELFPPTTHGFTCNDCPTKSRSGMSCHATLQWVDGDCGGVANTLACKDCTNKVCTGNTYQDGTCGEFTGTGLTCKTCVAPTCGDKQYLTGTCGNGKNSYECKDCENKQCTGATVQTGTCDMTTGKGLQCDACPAKTRSVAGCNNNQYVTGTCGNGDLGYKCSDCENASCPSRQSKSGSCHVTTGKGFTCSCKADYYPHTSKNVVSQDLVHNTHPNYSQLCDGDCDGSIGDQGSCAAGLTCIHDKTSGETGGCKFNGVSSNWDYCVDEGYDGKCAVCTEPLCPSDRAVTGSCGPAGNTYTCTHCSDLPAPTCGNDQHVTGTCINGVDSRTCVRTPCACPKTMVNWGGWGGHGAGMSACEGDCDRDSDCAGSLECMENEVPANCDGNYPGAYSGHDICGDPAAVAESVACCS